MIPPDYPKLAALADAQLAVFPTHTGYLARRFSGLAPDEWAFAEEVAGLVLAIAGSEIVTVCEDYRWFTDVILEEEIFFRREGRYRLSQFHDAVEQVYDDPIFMTRSMNGVLATQLWWRNHTDALRFFRDRFLAANPPGFSHLEVGPGHGLLLHLAAAMDKCAEAEGWDVSDSSLACTRRALDVLTTARAVVLRKVELFAAPSRTFSSIAFSEVLEHLEAPLEALRVLYRLLAKNGRIFVHAPVNSPAPDHLTLFRTPESVRALVEEAGFTVIDTLYAPCTGATLERARRSQLSISACIIATRR